MHICTPSYVEGVPFKGHFKKIKAKSLKERLESILSEDEESELRVDGTLEASAADVAEGRLAVADAPEGDGGDGPEEVVKEALHPQRPLRPSKQVLLEI